MGDRWVLAGATRDGRLVVKDGLKVGYPYEVSVVPRSPTGARRDPEDGTRVGLSLMGRRKQPANVTNLLGTVVHGMLVLRWDAATDSDTKGFQIRHGVRWLGAMTDVALCSENVWVTPADWIGSRTFRVKAVNRAGIMSDLETTVTVTNASTDWIVTNSQTEETGFAGTKTNMAVSGSNLILSVATGLSGTYQTNTLTWTSVGTRRIFVTLETDIADVALTVDKLCIAADSPYMKRKTVDVMDGAGWEGTENNDIGACDQARFPIDADTIYSGTGGVDRVYDFTSSLGITLEYRTSTDGGGSWSSWARYIPFVVSLNAIQVRVSITTPHKGIIPRIRNLQIHVALDTQDGWLNKLQHVTLEHTSNVATAAGTQTYGNDGSASLNARYYVPTGKVFCVMGFSGGLDTGPTPGTYTLSVITRKNGSTNTTLGSTTSTENKAVMFGGASGTIQTPLVSYVAGNVLQVGWDNAGSSPGAMAANTKLVKVWGVLIDA